MFLLLRDPDTAQPIFKHLEEEVPFGVSVVLFVQEETQLGSVLVLCMCACMFCIQVMCNENILMTAEI